jgi:hypothetical protein
MQQPILLELEAPIKVLLHTCCTLVMLHACRALVMKHECRALAARKFLLVMDVNFVNSCLCLDCGWRVL